MENNLLPLVQKKLQEHKDLCLRKGITIQVTSTYRSIEEQDRLYSQGRTSPGAIVTNAKGGQSFHNWKVAYDVVPIINGKAAWDQEAIFYAIGEFGKQVGLEWGGDWTTFKDLPHFQLTFGYTFSDFLEGRVDYKKYDVETVSVDTPPKETKEDIKQQIINLLHKL